MYHTHTYIFTLTYTHSLFLLDNVIKRFHLYSSNIKTHFCIGLYQAQGTRPRYERTRSSSTEPVISTIDEEYVSPAADDADYLLIQHTLQEIEETHRQLQHVQQLHREHQQIQDATQQIEKTQQHLQRIQLLQKQCLAIQHSLRYSEAESLIQSNLLADNAENVYTNSKQETSLLQRKTQQQMYQDKQVLEYIYVRACVSYLSLYVCMYVLSRLLCILLFSINKKTIQY